MKCQICNKELGLKDLDYTETLINNKIAYHCASHNRDQVVDFFKKKEEKKLRAQASTLGCSDPALFDLFYSQDWSSTIG